MTRTFGRRQIDVQLAQAAQVQAQLLPTDIPDIPGFELAARCVPANDVGGDFYDWQSVGRGTTHDATQASKSPEILRFSLGDVMGKGMAAALLMATARASLRALALRNTPAECVSLAAAALDTDLVRSSSFVTLFHAQLDVAERRLRYVDAGHGYVFILRRGGTVEELHPQGVPLGVLPDYQYEEGETHLLPGDTLVVYSDGLPEARPDLSTDHNAIAQELAGAGSALDMVYRLLAMVVLRGKSLDDLTFVVLRCKEDS
jgi:phosphoserine phosphatase RsbU/P